MSTTNKPTSTCFYRPDALPVAQPTVSKHLREDMCDIYLGAAASWFEVLVDVTAGLVLRSRTSQRRRASGTGFPDGGRTFIFIVLEHRRPHTASNCTTHRRVCWCWHRGVSGTASLCEVWFSGAHVEWMHDRVRVLEPNVHRADEYANFRAVFYARVTDRMTSLWTLCSELLFSRSLLLPMSTSQHRCSSVVISVGKLLIFCVTLSE